MRHNSRKFGLTSGALILTALLTTLLVAGMTQAAEPPLLPFDRTGDLFVTDSGCRSILRITQDGTIAVAVTRAEIEAVAGGSGGNYFSDNGIAFDAAGTMYFVASVANDSDVFAREPGGPLTMLASEAALESDVGGEVDADGLAFGSDGLLYVSDDGGDRVLRVHPTSGDATEYVAKAAFEALGGIASADIEAGIVGSVGGVIYVLSEGGPDAIFAVASGGTPSVLASGAPFADLDVFMTRSANGDLIVSDNSHANMLHRVTAAGGVTAFLSEAELKAVTGGDVDLEGGIAFDSLGNFYVAESDSDSILKFDNDLNGSVWVSDEDIEAVTGVEPDLDGGIAFAVVPASPVGGEAYPANKRSILAPWIVVAVMLAGGMSWYLLRHRRARS